MSSNKTSFKIGKHLEELRKSRNETQQELANALGVKRETVNQWESESRQLKAEAVVNLAKHFGVSSDNIVGLSFSEAQAGEREKIACDYLGIDDHSAELIKKHSSAVRLLCSANNAEAFLKSFANIGLCVDMINNAVSAAEIFFSLLKDGKDTYTETGEAVELDGVELLLNDTQKSLRLAVFEFAEESKMLAEAVYNTRKALHTAQNVERMLTDA